MNPLRKRMIEDLEIRNYSPRTIKSYIFCVSHFAKFFGKSPEFLGPEEVRRYQVYLVHEKKASWALLNQTVCALRFLYRHILQKDWMVNHIPFAKKPRTLPVVLSRQEIAKLFQHVRNLKHRMVLKTMYASGLRLSEAVNLLVSDIDSQRMLIRVRQGKGKKDRYAPLSPTLLAQLREYWRSYQPQSYLFPGRDRRRPINTTAVQRAVGIACRFAGLLKPATTHTMRHCFATHHLEAGTDLKTLQVVLGHADLNTTALYLHVNARASQAATQAKDLLMGLDDKDSRP